MRIRERRAKIEPFFQSCCVTFVINPCFEQSKIISKFALQIQTKLCVLNNCIPNV